MGTSVKFTIIQHDKEASWFIASTEILLTYHWYDIYHNAELDYRQ